MNRTTSTLWIYHFDTFFIANSQLLELFLNRLTGTRYPFTLIAEFFNSSRLNHAGHPREGRPPNTQTTGFCGDASTTAQSSTAGAFNAVADAFVEHRSPSCDGAASRVTAVDLQRRGASIGDAFTTTRPTTAGASTEVADASVEYWSPSCEGAASRVTAVDWQRRRASLVTAMDWQRRRGVASQLGAPRVVAIRRDLQLSKAAARRQHICACSLAARVDPRQPFDARRRISAEARRVLRFVLQTLLWPYDRPGIPDSATGNARRAEPPPCRCRASCAPVRRAYPPAGVAGMARAPPSRVRHRRFPAADLHRGAAALHGGLHGGRGGTPTQRRRCTGRTWCRSC